MEGLNVTQTVTSNRGERAATIRYQIHSGDANVAELNMPISLDIESSPVSIEPNGGSFAVTQELMTVYE